MRRVLSPGLLVAALVVAFVAAPADARRSHRPSGIAGTVLDTTCAGPCPQPLSTSPPYTGAGLTVSVRRVSDGVLVASLTLTDGTFRVRTRKGRFDVTASVPTTDPCGPAPVSAKIVCPVATAVPACGPSSDTARVQVRRHRFTQVELHVQNTCILTPQ